jgi:hypothetical protein
MAEASPTGSIAHIGSRCHQGSGQGRGAEKCPGIVGWVSAVPARQRIYRSAAPAYAGGNPPFRHGSGGLRALVGWVSAVRHVRGHTAAPARNPPFRARERRATRTRSGRIEARSGLRMMPTFPRSPLSFRTAGFPRYGWKAGFQMVPSRTSLRLSLLPTSASRRPVCIHPSCTS